MSLPPFVSAEWLRAHLDEVLPADVRWYLDKRSGRAAYSAGHLPGAVFVDLDDALAAPLGDGRHGRHPLPDPGSFADAMSRLGIGDDVPVVAYDDAGGLVAARLAWMLRALGHPAAVLDGGLQGFAGELTQAEPRQSPRCFTPRPWPPALLAGLEAASDPANLVLDAREPARYRGEVEPVDPRAGHIPGARSLPARENLGASGSLLPLEELAARLRGVGVDGRRPVVSYCGSGVTACHNLLVIEHAGLGHGRLYPGSWSEYCSDPARPAAGAAGSRAAPG